MSQNKEISQTISEEELLESSQKTIEDLLTDEELLFSSQSQERTHDNASQGSQAPASQGLNTTFTISSQGSEILESVDSESSKSNEDEDTSQ